MSIRGMEGVSINVAPVLFGAGTTVELSTMVCKAGDEQRSTDQTPRNGSPPPPEPVAFALARKTILPLLLIDGWLKLKKFFPAPAEPGGELALFATVIQFPVALEIVLLQVLATGVDDESLLPPHAVKRIKLHERTAT